MMDVVQYLRTVCKLIQVLGIHDKSSFGIKPTRYMPVPAEDQESYRLQHLALRALTPAARILCLMTISIGTRLAVLDTEDGGQYFQCNYECGM